MDERTVIEDVGRAPLGPPLGRDEEDHRARRRLATDPLEEVARRGQKRPALRLRPGHARVRRDLAPEREPRRKGPNLARGDERRPEPENGGAGPATLPPRSLHAPFSHPEAFPARPPPPIHETPRRLSPLRGPPPRRPRGPPRRGPV